MNFLEIPMRNLFRAAALSLAMVSTAAFAAGTSDSSSETPEKSKYEQAVELIEDEAFAEAQELLERVVQAEPQNADAWNYLGFAQRKQGNFEDSLISYEKALAINPEHIGANEYLGELYLQTKMPEKAEERLAVLKAVCGDCEEAEELEEAIADYRAANPS